MVVISWEKVAVSDKKGIASQHTVIVPCEKAIPFPHHVTVYDQKVGLPLESQCL